MEEEITIFAMYQARKPMLIGDRLPKILSRYCNKT